VKAAHLAYDALSAISADQLPDRPHDLWVMDAVGQRIELHMTYTRISSTERSIAMDEEVDHRGDMKS
jgi:hypothetical protein